MNLQYLIILHDNLSSKFECSIAPENSCLIQKVFRFQNEKKIRR